MCEYLNNTKCLLKQSSCKESNNDKCEIYQKLLKKKSYSKDIYNIKKDITCKNCGSHIAYQYEGKLFPNGLNKEEIDRFPQIYGKYYNRTHLSPAVGFGGTIPYTCASCGKQGLIGISLEGYEDLFEE